MAIDLLTVEQHKRAALANIAEREQVLVGRMRKLLSQEHMAPATILQEIRNLRRESEDLAMERTQVTRDLALIEKAMAMAKELE